MEMFIFFLLLAFQSLDTNSLQTTANKCKCGIYNYNAPSIGQSKPLVYPWMVALLDSQGKQYCDGTIISEKFVLTAAHCLTERQPSQVQLVVGAHDLSQLVPENIYKSGRFVIHSEFKKDGNGYLNDVGLVELKNYFNFTDNIQPVCLFREDVFSEQETFLVTGWGQIKPTLKAQVLQQIYLKKVDNLTCSEIWSRKIGDEQICVGQKMRNICEGDDGGPLMVYYQSQIYQEGIASYAGPVCGDRYPGVFTRIHPYYSWIRREVNSICGGDTYNP